MRKVMLLIVVGLLLSTAALAQRKSTLSVFASPGSSGSSGNVGLAFDRLFADRIALHAAVAYERHSSYPYIVADDGSIIPVPVSRLSTYPVDVTLRYQFVNDTRWKPYIGLGAHYIAAPTVPNDFRYRNHYDGEIDGGVLFLVRPSWGLTLNGRVIAGDREPYDDVFKASVGLAWRF